MRRRRFLALASGSILVAFIAVGALAVLVALPGVYMGPGMMRWFA
ncbi:MAG TPA: hypothetical protein VFA31_08660 [Candidatus Polarisedimenticolia bacterium]|jgi:hypothetical protein|nr:hypothetical protein [Candidatus Polarisedimenticolia bacterium]